MQVPENITREHMLSAIARIQSEGVPNDARSTTYDVIYEGGKYPPKLVLAWANSFANGEELDRGLFQGGQDKECFRIIANNGFMIERKTMADIKEDIPFFEANDFVVLERRAGEKRDSNDDAQTKDLKVLKDCYEKTRFWMDEVKKNLFPGGASSIRRDPTNQASVFHEYNWAKIYPSQKAKDIKSLSYTVGINIVSGFIIKVDTVNVGGEKRELYEAYRDKNKPSVIRLEIPIEEGLSLGWAGLIKRSIEYFKQVEPHYRQLDELLGYGIYGAVEAGQAQEGGFYSVLQQFVQQENDLAVSAYPRSYSGLPLKVSFGVGNLARIPWIAFLASEQSVSNGIYPVYLHYKEENLLILARGLSETSKPGLAWVNTGETIKEYFLKNLAKRPARYGDSYIYKVYHLGAPLEKAAVEQDLASLLAEYKSLMDISLPQPPSQPRPTEIAPSDWIPSVCEFMTNNGFYFNQADVANFYLSLRTKPFVILAGISGTGKTQIVRQFAKAIGYGDERHCVLIPVRPDWADNTDLVGYRNIQGIFEQQAMLRVLQDAMNNPDEPFFVILDEMNLARVEHYFSDFLSVMETREKGTSGAICTDAIVKDDTVNDGEPVTVPQNVMIVGTVNMDESTHPFSRKVLDRANALEMNTIALAWAEPSATSELEAIEGIYADAFVTPYLNANKDLTVGQKSALNDVVTLLVRINELLEPAGLHFGYRVRDEIAFYLTQHRELGFDDADIMSGKDALDYQLMQKVLPRIQGSSVAVLTALLALLKELTGANINSDMELGAVEQALAEEGEMVSFRRSVKKLLFMLRRFHEDGFTSFWL
jgi:MoxR-like ATPase